MTFTLILASSTKHIHRVEEFFATVNTVLHLNDEKFHTLLIAVTEAVNNGILHGNKQDPAKHVTVLCTVTEKMVTVSVKDEGPGFSPDSLPDPLHEDNLLRSGGRGVFLMRSLMEAVEYNEAGNVVIMKMKWKD